jgi:GGDEF domain-containing protein
VEHFFDEADMALFQVKRAGRDAIAVRSPGTQAKITP